MPEVILPATFLSLLAEFRSVFTSASFQNFVVLVAGFLHALGHHRLTDALRALGPLAPKHFLAYYRFFSRAPWSLDELGFCLLGLLLRCFPSAVVELIVDDTLTRRTGKKVALATMHADPLLRKGGRPFSSYGHVFVVLSFHLHLPWLSKTGWALPLLFRLYEGRRRGGRKDSPSDQRRALRRRAQGKAARCRVRLTDRRAVRARVLPCPPRPDIGPLPDRVRPSKLVLAAQMILLVARRFPKVRFRVLADHLYAGAPVLKEVHQQVSNVSFVMRGHPTAALYHPPPPRRPGQRGRSARKGPRLPNPKTWAARPKSAFRLFRVSMYGHTVPVRLASFVGIADRSLPGHLLRYVIVKDPQGIYKTDYLLSTDPELGQQEVVTSYSHRWPLERTIQECKQKLRIQQGQCQLPTKVRRTVPFGMLLYSLVVLWYARRGPLLAASTDSPKDPWYKKTARPSFTDMMACLRRQSWAEGISATSCTGKTRQEILTAYLARVVAAA